VVIVIVIACILTSLLWLVLDRTLVRPIMRCLHFCCLSSVILVDSMTATALPGAVHERFVVIRQLHFSLIAGAFSGASVRVFVRMSTRARSFTFARWVTTALAFLVLRLRARALVQSVAPTD